jgi:hypothetical protein
MSSMIGSVNEVHSTAGVVKLRPLSNGRLCSGQQSFAACTFVKSQAGASPT